MSLFDRVITEAAKNSSDLPDDYVVVIASSGTNKWISYRIREGAKTRLAKNSDDVHGSITIGPMVASEGPCLDAWEIKAVVAKKGWGPLLYDIALELATKKVGGLAPDRDSVTTAARGVWDYYNQRRGDVKKTQLDDLLNSLTRGKKDNCSQVAAQAAEKEWKNSSLSKRYSKKPSVLTQLKATGKLVIL